MCFKNIFNQNNHETEIHLSTSQARTRESWMK